MKMIKNALVTAVKITTWICFSFIAFLAAIVARYVGKVTGPRLVWGSTPVINNSYWSKSLKNAGYLSETFTIPFYRLNNRGDWDRVLDEEYNCIHIYFRNYFAFIHSLFLYDIFFISFDGYFIGKTRIWFLQAFLFKIAGKKTVLLPYGSDSYVYRSIRSVSTIHGLMMSYPSLAKEQKHISKVVDYWCKYADVVLPGVMGPDGFGRWDAILPSILFIDQHVWKSQRDHNQADGKVGKVVVAHAPNHRGVKGTEFVIDAVEKLKAEGLQIELLLIENVPNVEVRRILAEDVDILVEQLIFTGHGLNGIEGMASGLPVISNLEDENFVQPFRRWSYFNECPIVSASPETLVDTLRKLVEQPALRQELGVASRMYVEKYHGLEASAYLFENVIKYLEGGEVDLINLYHPLKGYYKSNEPKIEVPLINNHIK